MRERVRGVVTFARLAFGADPARTVVVVLVTLVEAGIRALWPLWLKLITEAALRRDVADVLVATAAYGGSVAMLGLTNLPRINLEQILSEKVAFGIDRRLIELTAGIPTIEHHERSDYQDKIKVLQTQRGALAGTVTALIGSLMTLGMLGGTLVLLSRIHPVLLALPLFALPSAVAGAKAAALRLGALEETAEEARAAEHLIKLATGASPGKEIRIFRLAPELLRRHQEIWARFDRHMHGAEMRAGSLSLAGAGVFTVAYGAALSFVALRAVASPGSTSIGDLVMTIAITTQLNQHLGGVVQTVRWLGSNLQTVTRYLWMVDYATGAMASAGGSTPPPDSLATGIDFHEVSFAYPGTDVTVLDRIDLQVPAGSTVAIVGENGAGKSTLVKLLCRFYDPTEGSISLDGLDLRDVDTTGWRRRISSGFQDFARLELLAREAVGVGSLPMIDDEAAVLDALERASAADVTTDLPEGLGTQLGKLFAGGVELSGGQWQKVALGRAMMREAPLLLVLDEPTASLDAETEHALFERYGGAAKRVSARNGGITILVSHRFSTVRMADLIVVLDRGRIVETGTHAELVARGNLYAELYGLQARAYR